MNQPSTSSLEILAATFPFNQLNQATLESLEKRLQFFRYRLGQSILRHETLPYQVAILVEGRARVLGYARGNQEPFTLQMLGPGALLGWAGLIRGLPCETAIASEETLCLTLPAQEFLDLLEREPVLSNAFKQQVTAAEIANLLAGYIQGEATTIHNIKDLSQDALEQAQVAYQSLTQSLTPTLPTDHLWFISSNIAPAKQPFEGFKVPTLQDFLHGLSPTITGVSGIFSAQTSGVRLIGIPESLLAPASDHETNGHDAAAEAIIDVQPVHRANAIPYAPEIPPEPEIVLPTYSDNGQRPKYPFASGKGALGGTLACCQMLTQYFAMPFRRDIVRRVLADQLQRTGRLTLQICGAVTEMMGLRAQLVKVPANALPRLYTPALIEWQEGFAVLYETSARELVLGVPELGLIRRTPKEFAATWGEDGEVLLLQATKSTPQSKFGLQWFWPSIQRYWGVLITVFVASFFVQVFSLANPLMIQVIIDRVIVQNSPDTLDVLGLLLVVFAVFEALLSSLRTYLFVDTTNRIDMTLGSEIIDHLFRLPLRYFEKRPVGELASRVNELERIRQFLTGTALTAVLDVVFSLLYVFVMFLYSWKLTLAAFATIPLSLILTALVSPVVRRQLRAKAERNAETQSHLVEVVSGIQTVKSQNIELKARWKWQERYARYVSSGFRNVLTSTAAGSLNTFFNKTSGLIVLWYGASMVLLPTDDPNHITLGQLIAFRIIAGYVTGPILRLSQLWQNFQETALSLERLSDIIDTPQESDETDRDKIPMPIIKGHVQYEEISFRFASNGPLNLVNVNLDFAPGTFVGIVGQSGSGKSTLVKLLARLYEPQSGRIIVDDYDIAKVELYSLRRQIGIVPQDSLLFEGTVQENIALTNPSASTEEVIEAAKVAVAHDFIMGLPAGYNTKVGERGAALSGGQRQRIALARTILQNPQMLVLDEATSALDYETERQVCHNLQAYFSARTVFFITHRLNTIRQADIILVMDQGAAVELGTHAELMNQRGRYYCLFQQQEAPV